MRSASVPAVLLAAALGLVACSSGGSDAGSGSSATSPPATTSSTRASTTASTTTTATTTATATTTTTTAAPDDGPQIVVRVVADSEVPDGVSELLDQEPGIEVASMQSIGGATMAELDPSVDEALAQHPDVLVYAGGTNDLKVGPSRLIKAMSERLVRYGTQACVVMAIPIFRYERGTDAEVAERTQGTRVLEEFSASAGAKVVSYLDVSIAMDERGEDFFAEGSLGDLHPDPRAYPGIAKAIAEQVRACS